MSWKVVLPIPPSGNHANTIGRGHRTLRDGSVGTYAKIVKTADARAYMASAAMLVRVAKPSGWKWSGGYIVTEWRFWFGNRPMDAVNAMKVIEDVIFPAIGVNDVFDMPRVMSIETGVPTNQQRVEVTICD